MSEEVLSKRLELFASLAASAKGTKSREHAVKKLSQVVDKIVPPKFAVKKLREALIDACIEPPDFGDPVVFESNKHGGTYMHLNGTFDLDVFTQKYFAPDRVQIDADVQ